VCKEQGYVINMNGEFNSFSNQHYVTLTFFGLILLLTIFLGLKAKGRMKMWIGYCIASMSLAVLVFDLILRLMTHTMNVLNDLPLFLCDLTAIFLPFIILRMNRKWLGIFYFWTLAGTLQALITPELKSSYPAFEFFRYFIMHGGVVIAVLYCIIVFRVRITWRDLWNAVLYIQFYLVGIHIINMVLHSNYSYTMAKPVSSTILDFMGDWPWYILSAEILMVVLFIFLLIPFLIRFRKKNPPFETSDGMKFE
jgi:hypothetical integral membrane protein (TIGR02206 family)